MRLKLVVPPTIPGNTERRFSCWIGGSILASLVSTLSACSISDQVLSANHFICYMRWMLLYSSYIHPLIDGSLYVLGILPADVDF